MGSRKVRHLLAWSRVQRRNGPCAAAMAPESLTQCSIGTVGACITTVLVLNLPSNQPAELENRHVTSCLNLVLCIFCILCTHNMLLHG